ncbi:MAG: hypothetical protein HY743_03580 [Deltaproteobacteria bacterium]|nr:hypothetical protein [Deltaproteobacteria bacterium]
MRKLIGTLGILALLGWWLVPPVAAQWGAIQSGADALRRAKEAEKQPQQPTQQPTKAYEGSASMSDTKTGVSTASVTYQNKVRNFSYTIPAGWRLERGNPNGAADRDNIIFMKPGTTCGFTIHWTQMVPSFPRKASVDASYKQAMEEKTIGKYLAVKRRDQGGKDGVIGWETIETAEKGSGGFQRIQWQCYDSQNYMYSFMAHSEPKDFNANRAEMQRIIDSIKFGR